MDSEKIANEVFGGEVSPEEIAVWFAQFAPEDQWVAARLLEGFDYTSTQRLKKMVVELYKAITAAIGTQREVWYVPVGYVAKSGAVIAYFFRTMNGLSLNQFIAPADVQTLGNAEGAVVFLDDYLGSGHQATQVWDNVARPLSKTKLSFSYAVLIGHKKGMAHVRAKTKLVPIAARLLSEENLPFGAKSKIFPDANERQRAKEIARKYGERVYANHALGYSDTQGLLGFCYSTPNNTLPIFWSTENGWKPLLTHGESFRNPAFLMGPPPGLHRPAPAQPSEAFAQQGAIDKVDLPDQVSQRVFEEFKRLPIVNLMARVFNEMKTEPEAIDLLLSLIQELKINVHEKEPVWSALLLLPADGSADDIGDLVSGAPARTKDKKQLATLASWIPGQDGGVVLSAAGDVLGAYSFRDSNGFSDRFLPDRYRKAAACSKRSKGLLFLFNGDGRVLLFYQGKRILTFKSPGWHWYQVDGPEFHKLCERHKLDVPVLDQVLRLALLLSDSGRGTLMTLGEHERVQAIADTKASMDVIWNPLDITSNEGVLLGLLSQDGASIISGGGQVVETMKTLRPQPDSTVEVEVGRGTKHQTAATVSKATNAIAIAVSIDGRVTVYSDGVAVFKIMG